jgi:Ca2+-binding RTX toxin-like protein
MPFNPIDGSDEAETIPGTQGADHIRAMGGDDTVYGDAGNDSIEGGAGNDRLYGGNGRDTIRGGEGDDAFEGSDGNDRLYGDAGRDAFLILSNSSAGSHSAYGGADDDWMFVAQRVDAHFDGGAGTDLLHLYWADIFAPVSGSLATGFAGDGSTVSLTDVDRLILVTGGGDDTITGGEDRDDIAVLGGANVVDAGAGDDRVTYRVRVANVLDGGDGNDLLRMGPDYGAFATGFTFDGSGPVVADGFGSTIVNFERFWLSGSYYADTLTGGADRDRLDGYYGDDVISGMDGNDKLLGWLGNDLLSGGEGNDQLSGGIGQDTLVGGAGADTFIFRRPDGPVDRIEDFSGTEGDHLALNARWYGLATGGGVTLSLDTASGTGKQFIYDTATGLLSFDRDGTGSGAAIQITVLAGAPVLTAADFELL